VKMRFTKLLDPCGKNMTTTKIVAYVEMAWEALQNCLMRQEMCQRWRKA